MSRESYYKWLKITARCEVDDQNYLAWAGLNDKKMERVYAAYTEATGAELDYHIKYAILDQMICDKQEEVDDAIRHYQIAKADGEEEILKLSYLLTQHLYAIQLDIEMIQGEQNKLETERKNERKELSNE